MRKLTWLFILLSAGKRAKSADRRTGWLRYNVCLDRRHNFSVVLKSSCSVLCCLWSISTSFKSTWRMAIIVFFLTKNITFLTLYGSLRHGLKIRTLVSANNLKHDSNLFNLNPIKTQLLNFPSRKNVTNCTSQYILPESSNEVKWILLTLFNHLFIYAHVALCRQMSIGIFLRPMYKLSGFDGLVWSDCMFWHPLPPFGVQCTDMGMGKGNCFSCFACKRRR